MSDDAARLAERLIESQRTIVLATAGAAPWAAPVYYLNRAGRFWFFSSPTSRHVRDALDSGRCAAAVFRDSDDWRDIEGLQMDGAIERIALDTDEATVVFAAYLDRYPTVREFFDGATPTLEQLAAKFKSELYTFTPTRALYLNNKAGFGKRVEVQLPG